MQAQVRQGLGQVLCIGAIQDNTLCILDSHKKYNQIQCKMVFLKVHATGDCEWFAFLITCNKWL